MDFGKLSKRCRFERPVTSQDPVYGAPESTWQVFGVYWCNVTDVLPYREETIRNGLQTTKQRVRLRIRYAPQALTITPAFRVVIMRQTEKTYAIIGGPAEIGDRDGIEFMLEIAE
jgi:head-tail adaptor